MHGMEIRCRIFLGYEQCYLILLILMLCIHPPSFAKKYLIFNVLPQGMAANPGFYGTDNYYPAKESSLVLNEEGLPLRPVSIQIFFGF